MRGATLFKLAIVGSAAAIVAYGVACSDDEHRRTSREQAAASGGGACEAQPGNLPAADCDNSDKACTSSPGCNIDEGRCGSKSTCLPIGDNKGKMVQDFRIRRLNIATPPALAGNFIQNTVVNLNIDLAEKSCGELGKGLFTWILRVDRTNNRLLTGGSPPPKDPLGEGFCFANFELNGAKVEPIDVSIQFEGNKFKSLERKNVKIPIFLSDQLASAILLPISDVRIENVSISDDGNCVGKYVPDALDPACVEDRTLCPKWQTSGALGGYITLEEADGVKIRDLNNKSLCSFLAADEGLVCKRDGANKIVYKGDFCSQTKTGGGCADSVWLAATFAASAAKIFDGKGKVEGCSGSSTGDAGADGSTDAAPDAPADAATD
jgi:hypothetical protein